MTVSNLDPLPRREDFFPKTRRGHGTTHPSAKVDREGRLLRNGTACVEPTCNRNQPKSNNLHEDQAMNLKDWCDDHKLSTKHDSAGTAMHYATGGR